MGLAVLPFLFWGIESYRNVGSEGFVAVVDGEEISRREYEQALRDHHERMRSMLGANFDSSMLDSFEVKNSVMERLIQQRLLQREAVNNGFVVLDTQLIKTIREVPAFQKENKFSKQQYEELLRAQGLTPTLFESRVRQELLLQQLLDGYSENGFVPKAVAEKVKYLSTTQREINQFRIDPEQFMAQVVPDEGAITAYYEKHQTDFDLPERARVEYLVLSMDEMAKQEVVSEEAVNNYFSEHQSEFGQPEERKASHILISVTADATDEEKQQAREKADNLLSQVKQDPQQFAVIAKEFSNDPGSAAQGGDLGFFGRGVMVKAFEDKIFSMQLGEISDLVETDFGFHIIQLTEVKEAKQADLSEVREEIESKLKLQAVSNSFGETAEDFRNVVYEQSDTLEGAANKFGLSIQESDWISRNNANPVILGNDKLLTAIFSDETIKNQRNTEAIEVKPDTFVAARVVEHRPATTQSQSVVEDQIIAILKKQMAEEKAIEEGKVKLAALQDKGEDAGVAWSEAKQISYMQSQGLDHEVLRSIFRAETKTLPVYLGMPNSAVGGYDLIRINKIIDPETADDAAMANFSGQLQQMLTQEEMFSYLSLLRKKYEVKVKQDAF